MQEPDQPPSQGFVAAAYAVVVVLALLLALWGSFLVPFRVGGVLVPVSWVIAGAGNVALALAGARLLGRAGAAGPGVLWLAVVATFQSRRTEGDLVVPGTYVGLGFLLVGALASAMTYGYLSQARVAEATATTTAPPVASPRGRARR